MTWVGKLSGLGPSRISKGLRKREHIRMSGNKTLFKGERFCCRDLRSEGEEMKKKGLSVDRKGGDGAVAGDKR